MQSSLIFLLLLFPSLSELRVLAWNVESGKPSAKDPANGSDPATIANELKALKGYDIVGLSEVTPSAAKLFTDALSDNSTFLSVISSTGMDDRLLLAFNSKKLELLSAYELHKFGDWQLNSLDERGRYRHRSPLVAEFIDRKTKIKFLVTLNHLARGDEKARVRQAIGLRKWAENQTLPIIALGDFNFDVAFENLKGNRAYERFMEGNVWQWVKPELIDSNWADTDPLLPLEKRMDQYPDSILDFVFLANSKWPAKSWVVVREGDFPDLGETSDHRPVGARVFLR
ncbi:endonuclease/exonuclease/phosphatase family protein [Bythopirellula polymerisocia]|uniref:Endonuclease/Exonuclease/phosphatase family protein n=1 Tax=Bythopirellula polymerisocia TaxID=2528003 RepID=A0A5C6C092_9BACT|nr:endonuclease/exonuclease/phosphatase family protein [Bythopirellula polymerisocia]TWU17605.1 Endonuclease/Exonuclease/phosphatase family protein [Bythopirellula polymerisocia]